MISRIIIFLILNFGALAIGSISTKNGVRSEWYGELNKAPWTPPGWVFGAAWTIIMICFSVYMASLLQSNEDTKLILGLYILQWVLNVAWNPLFFSFHQIAIAFIVISVLTLVVGFVLFYYLPVMNVKTAFIVPYFVWLVIATSLNGYIYIKN